MTKELYFCARMYCLVKNVEQSKIAANIFYLITVTEIACKSPAVKVLNTDRQGITMLNLFVKNECCNIFEVKAPLTEQ